MRVFQGGKYNSRGASDLKLINSRSWLKLTSGLELPQPFPLSLSVERDLVLLNLTIGKMCSPSPLLAKALGSVSDCVGGIL